ncbi:MAG: 30S ribosomal protein S8 [Patescibacteria group bacterium]|nr:30S ribosomal protein S8 [Patescibacteria group bacterium]
MTDPIADMLTRIRNASAVKKPEVVIPFSKIKWQIAQILEREGWVGKIKEEENGSNGFKIIKINLKYIENQPAIKNLKRVSKPGLRVYVDKNNISKVLNGLGMSIISTSQGLLTNNEAKQKNVGGEIICEIY